MPGTTSQPGVQTTSSLAPAATYSAAELQQLVDEAAYFHLYSTPQQPTGTAIWSTSRNQIIGVQVNETLRRFDIRTYGPTERAPFRATNAIGHIAGSFTHKWMVIPDDYAALPGCNPPATPFNETRSQRFAMIDGICHLGDGADGFRGFGTGKTYPSRINGRSQLLATAIGTIVEGFGKFEGLNECTYVYCGTLDPECGFRGSLMIRVADPQATFRVTRTLQHIEPLCEVEDRVTYVLLRGQADPSDVVAPRVGPNGQLLGLHVEQGVNLICLDSSYTGRAGLQSFARPGQSIGKLSAEIDFNPAAQGGTVRDPIPFTTLDQFTFRGSDGGFLAHLVEGRVFNLEIPQGSGQKAIRFGGTGPLKNGTGEFAAIDGLMTDNSLVMFTPHVSASVYVLRLNDPENRYRVKWGGE